MKEHTHKELVEIGYKWCLSRCGFAFKELVTINSETPDVIGFNGEGSFMVEAKTSQPDFARDKMKFSRLHPQYGIGDWRFFIAVEGLIKIEQLPNMWGLLEVNKNGKVKISHNPFGKGNIYHLWKRCEKNNQAERNIMYSALRRIHKKGIIEEIYP